MEVRLWCVTLLFVDRRRDGGVRSYVIVRDLRVGCRRRGVARVVVGGVMVVLDVEWFSC